MNALAPKTTKAAVHYSPGMGTTRCKNCVHFEPPHRCEIVEGAISPEYWCEKFRRAKHG